MKIDPFILLALAIPVLLLGEGILRLVKPLARLNLPTPVVGGFVVAVALLALKVSKVGDIAIVKNTAATWWTFWVTTEWQRGQEVNVILPLLVIFYTTLGLCASWEMVRKGGMFLVLYIVSTGIASVLQNAAGMGVAYGLGAHPALGVACGSVSLMGGFSTSIAFTRDFETLGFSEAAATGVAAATFGMVMSNVVAAPLTTLLIRRKHLAAERERAPEAKRAAVRIVGVLDELRALAVSHRSFWLTLVLLLVCAKASAYVTFWISLARIALPVQVGAMIVGLLVRFLADLFKLRIVHEQQVEAIGAVTLALFLSMAMMTLDLSELSGVAVPMLIILTMQVVLLVVYALWINFRMMGRDYEAAVTSAGLLGFGLGATPNAIASMKSLVNAFGPAPKAFLVVPVTGAFLSDVVNVLVITGFLNVMR